MKTKHLFGLVAGLAVLGFTASAQAGVSVGFSFGAPIRYEPRCAPPVYYQPPVRYCPPPVRYCPPVQYYSAPRYERSYSYRDYNDHRRYRGSRDHRSYDRGHDRGHGGRR